MPLALSEYSQNNMKYATFHHGTGISNPEPAIRLAKERRALGLVLHLLGPRRLFENEAVRSTSAQGNEAVTGSGIIHCFPQKSWRSGITSHVQKARKLINLISTLF